MNAAFRSRLLGDPLVRAGQFAQAFRQVILIAIALLLPRMGVARADIGAWEQMQYLGYLLGFAWLTGIGQAYLAQVGGENKTQEQELTNALLRIGVLASVVVIGLALLFQSPLLAGLAGVSELPGWLYYLLFLLSHWPALLYEQVLLAKKAGRGLVYFSLASNLGLGLALVVPLGLGLGWSQTLPWLMAVSGLKFLLMVFGNHWRWGKRVSQKTLAQLLQRAGPLVLYAALGAIIVSFDPWFVNYWYQGDQDQFALYRYGTRELPLIVAITNGIGQAILPQFGANVTGGLARLRSSSRRLMHWFFPGAILVLLTSSWWWEPLFTPTFAEALPLFQLFLLVGVSRMIFPIVILTALDHGKVLVGLGVVELLLNAILSWWLVQAFGLLGIVGATVLAYSIDKLLAVGYLYFREGIRPQSYCAINWLLGYSAVLLLVYYWISG